MVVIMAGVVTGIFFHSAEKAHVKVPAVLVEENHWRMETIVRYAGE